jgi:ATP-dependent RNA helicase RhlE
VGRAKKKALLTHIINEHNWSQVLVFTRTKFGANNVAEHLSKNGIPAMALHGNKSQTARTQALADFKSGTIRALVATDIAARGIDIDELPHVVNYEIPNVSEDYVHRIGRTGRAGNSGEAVSLVCLDEEGFMQDIERFTKQNIEKVLVPGFEAEAGERAEPLAMGRQTIWGPHRNDAAHPRHQGRATRARRRRRQRWRQWRCARTRPRRWWQRRWQWWWWKRRRQRPRPAHPQPRPAAPGFRLFPERPAATAGPGTAPAR